MSMNTVRLGAVGAGWWATSNHFPIFAARDDVELVGVCGFGETLETVKKQFGFAAATENFDELLDMGIDALVITTPHDLHYEQAAKAIDRGIHVLVEKPVTLTAETAWDLVARAERAGIHFLVPLGWNYKPFAVEAKKLIDSGALVERFFSKLKHFRAVATRYDKRADNYLASVQLASIRIWLRHNESVT